MAAGEWNSIIEQRASWSKTLILKDGKGKSLDLTGYTAQMQLRDEAGNVVVELSTSNGRIAASGSELTLALSPTVTGGLAVLATHYDLFITAPSGVVTRLLAGVIDIVPAT